MRNPTSYRGVFAIGMFMFAIAGCDRSEPVGTTHTTSADITVRHVQPFHERLHLQPTPDRVSAADLPMQTNLPPYVAHQTTFYDLAGADLSDVGRVAPLPPLPSSNGVQNANANTRAEAPQPAPNARLSTGASFPETTFPVRPRASSNAFPQTSFGPSDQPRGFPESSFGKSEPDRAP